MDPVDRAAPAVSRLTRGGIAWTVAGAATGALRRDRTVFVRVAVATGAAIAASTALSYIVGRERPCRGQPSLIPCPDSPSFPSNHAAAAFAATTVLAGAGLERRLLLPVAALVAYSRVHVRAHAPADVIAGAALGSAIGHGLAARRPGQAF